MREGAVAICYAKITISIYCIVLYTPEHGSGQRSLEATTALWRRITELVRSLKVEKEGRIMNIRAFGHALICSSIDHSTTTWVDSLARLRTLMLIRSTHQSINLDGHQVLLLYLHRLQLRALSFSLKQT